MQYKLIVCGGTFDLLHKGHKNFLRQVFKQAEKVVIGLTSDNYTDQFKTEIFENFETRKENLSKFLIQEKALDKAQFVKIDDVYGPLLGKSFIVNAIAVTEETKNGAIQINKKRKSLGLPEVDVLVFKMDTAEDGDLISSSRIRSGEIDRNGRLFINPDWHGKTLRLPENLRNQFHKPFGNILGLVPMGISPDRIATIGDITTQKFNNVSAKQFISIVDFVVERHQRFNKLSDLGFEDELKTIKVDNPAGQITSELFQAVKNVFKNETRKIILVNGEEDLSVLPVLLAAPLGFLIYYGQPGQGLVEVLVTEGVKERGYQLLSKFLVE